MTKQCIKCKKFKPTIEFSRNSSKKDGLQTCCRECKKQYNALHYISSKEKFEPGRTKSRNARKKELRSKMMSVLENQSCADCGLTDNRVLEFDHLPEFQKENNISTMLAHSRPWHLIEEEMKKCEIVCANCHRIRTHIRSNSYRIQANKRF